MDEHNENEASFDPSRRKLCPDGSCVGVIGEDGRCRVCGRTEPEAESGVEPAAAVTEDVVSAGETAGESGGFDPRRRLCDDGSCVGVVGEDGVCPVCGRRSE